MKIRNEFERNILREANILVGGNLTIRETAKRTGMSKSAIHNHMVIHLPKINLALYLDVREILDKNKAERHIRGGMATRRKYLNMVR